MSRKQIVISLAGLTLALGVTVPISWLAFGGRLAATGPDRALEQAGTWIYGSQAVLAALVGAAAALLLGRQASVVRLVLLMFGAWLGELVVLTLGGNLVANEIDPPVAWSWWLLATAGPLQPVAASLGAVAASVVGRLAPRA
ncbi:MAG TPA: hypothetical protein VFK61_07405 [Candidatus Limnocylindria bacterium]|nr:hypothetical protein [Candidatus Limnocylindria bacterium]